MSDELRQELDQARSELQLLRSSMRSLSDKAELADTYEKWLLEIGAVIGCQHLDEQLPNCVITELQGDGAMRYVDELEALRQESKWIRRKLGLPEDANLQDLQGQMHVTCSNAFGYTEYIKAYRCEDKQGEIARLSAQLHLAEHPADGDLPIDEKWLRDVLKWEYHAALMQWASPWIGDIRIVYWPGYKQSEWWLDVRDPQFPPARHQHAVMAALKHITTRNELRRLLAALGVV